MLDHVTIGVSDIEQSTKFYDRALGPLGITRLYAKGNGSQAMASAQRPSSGSVGAIQPRQAPILPLRLRIAPRSTGFMMRRSRPAAETTDGPGCAHTTIPITMEPSFSIPTATISRRFAIRRKLSPHRCID